MKEDSYERLRIAADNSEDLFFKAETEWADKDIIDHSDKGLVT